MSLLMWAGIHGNLGMIRALIEAGADVNVPGKDNATALYWASRKGDLATVNALLSAGANANLNTVQGWSPLMASAWKGDVDIVKRLIPISEIDKQDVEGKTALWYAAKTGRPDVVKVLLELGADAEIRDTGGKRPIDMARKQTKYSLHKRCVALLEEEERTYLMVKARAIYDGTLPLPLRNRSSEAAPLVHMLASSIKKDGGSLSSSGSGGKTRKRKRSKYGRGGGVGNSAGADRDRVAFVLEHMYFPPTTRNVDSSILEGKGEEREKEEEGGGGLPLELFVELLNHWNNPSSHGALHVCNKKQGQPK